jgi:hypothetical protein
MVLHSDCLLFTFNILRGSHIIKLLNNELRRVLKEAMVAYMKVVRRQLTIPTRMLSRECRSFSLKMDLLTAHTPSMNVKDLNDTFDFLFVFTCVNRA